MDSKALEWVKLGIGRHASNLRACIEARGIGFQGLLRYTRPCIACYTKAG